MHGPCRNSFPELFSGRPEILHYFFGYINETHPLSEFLLLIRFYLCKLGEPGDLAVSNQRSAVRDMGSADP